MKAMPLDHRTPDRLGAVLDGPGPAVIGMVQRPVRAAARLASRWAVAAAVALVLLAPVLISEARFRLRLSEFQQAHDRAVDAMRGELSRMVADGRFAERRAEEDDDEYAWRVRSMEKLCHEFGVALPRSPT
jgi:hypothetical protein